MNGTLTARPSTVYGPLKSWRFGQSLGIDLIVKSSICSFNCIYCQLGAIQQVTLQRQEFVPTEWVREDLQRVDWSAVDVVTVSGNGEPTLATNLAQAVDLAHELSGKHVHILTNSTLLHLPEARAAVLRADVVACKLDAVDPAMLRIMNRPAPGVELERVIEGIAALRAEYHGKLSLQVMLMPATLPRVEEWIPLIQRIRPDEVQLNTPKRPYPLHWYLESRGDHARALNPAENRQLKVISREEAAAAERLLHSATGIPMISVYGES